MTSYPFREPPKPPGAESTRPCAAHNCTHRALPLDIYCQDCRDELTALNAWHQRQGVMERSK